MPCTASSTSACCCSVIVVPPTSSPTVTGRVSAEWRPAATEEGITAWIVPRFSGTRTNIAGTVSRPSGRARPPLAG